MVNLLAYILAAVLTLLSSHSLAQPVTTSVDRTEIVRGETVMLTIRVDGRQGGVRMDLTPLEADFQLVSTRTSSQLRAINNRTESWIDYNLTLFPLKEGELVIPSMTVAGEATNPINIKVLPQSQTGIAGKDLFLETVISKDSIYVQEQLLFTIRLYFTIQGIRNPVFTELDIPETVIQQIGTPNQYEKLVDGNRYGVYEKQYALFPQRSGNIVIPDIMFRGEVTDGSSNYVFRNLNTRTITSFANGYTIEVKEKPNNYPENAVWLPASEVELSQVWDNDLSNVRIGDSVNRIVRVEAFGLDGAALPPLPTQTIESINFYRQTPEIERTYIDGNIVGSRIEEASLVPTQTGTVRIPGLTLPWFDIDTEEVKYASLEDSAFRVGPLRSSAPDAEDNELGLVDEAPQNLNPVNENASLISGVETPLWITALASALVAALLAFFYRQFQHGKSTQTAQQRPSVGAPMYAQEIAPNEEAKAYSALVAASKTLHLPALRLAIIAWGRQYFADSDLHTLDELSQRTGDAEFKQVSIKIQQALYGASNEDAATLKPDVELLLVRVQALRDTRNQTHAQQVKDREYTLPPLYKS
jgi:hypothetical protein